MRAPSTILGSGIENAQPYVLDERAAAPPLEKSPAGPLPSAHLAPTDAIRGADAFYLPPVALPLMMGSVLLAPVALYLFILIRRRAA